MPTSTQSSGRASQLPWWSFFRRWLACQIAVVLLAGGYLGECLEPVNRMYRFWGWPETWALAIWLGGIGLAAALMLQIFARLTGGRTDRWLAPWFYFLAVLAGFNLFPSFQKTFLRRVPGPGAHGYFLFVWGLGVLLTIGGYANSRLRRWAALAWRRLVWLWPILPILAWNFGLAPKWCGVSGAPARLGPAPNGVGAPVVVLIPDMVGYEDAFDDEGAVRAELPGLAAFAECATIYHRARSCGHNTSTSMSGFFLQAEVGEPQVGRDAVRWRGQTTSRGRARPATEFKWAWPYRVRAAGGRAIYIGYYLPFKQLLPGAWNEALIRCFYGVECPGAGSVLAEAIAHHAIRYLVVSKDPVAGFIKQFDLYMPPMLRHHRRITREVQAGALDFIRTALSPGDFLVVHLPIPHQPIAFAADGSPSRFAWNNGAGYADQWRYADILLSELLAELKRSGRWDESWVVVMSDHGSHLRPEYEGQPEKKRHVPLLVKAPGQTQRRDVSSPIRLADLSRLLGVPAPRDPSN